MKNVTITLPDALASLARVEAAKQDKSLSRFIADLLAERCRPAEDPMTVLESFFSGPGYPGISKAWQGRERLYAEREEKLLRGHQPSDLPRRPERAGKARARRGLAEKGGQRRYLGPQSSKPK
jgi:hypothetical protein